MGVGKTTIGKRLARRLNLEYCDLDEYIVKSENQSINELFAERGEQGFRELEREALVKITDSKIVISTGGGAPCFFDNLDIMLKNGIVVWLSMEPKVLINRLLSGKSKRPLLANLPEAEVLGFVENQLQERETFYQKAHISFDSANMNSEKMDRLVMEIQNYSK